MALKYIWWLLPPANEVWGKVICLQVCVCPQGGRAGYLVWRVPGPGESWSQGGAWSRGLAPGGGGVCSGGGSW